MTKIFKFEVVSKITSVFTDTKFNQVPKIYYFSIERHSRFAQLVKSSKMKRIN